MPDSRPNRRILGTGELGRRIMLAFVSVAVLAVVVVVARSGAALRLTDPAGRPVAATPGFAAFLPRPELGRSVIVAGRPVGRLTLRFGSAGFSAVIDRFLAERWRVRQLAAAPAVLLAGLASFFVARQIGGPLERLLAAMRARQAGNRDARIRDVRSVGMLREVLEGYNAATNALDARDRVQRNLVANMAHEVRTPVAVLQAGLEAIQDGLATPFSTTPGSGW